MAALEKYIKSTYQYNNLIKYMQNIFWLVSDKMIQLISSLIVGIWVAKYLGPEQLGLISYSQSVVALFIPFATIGIHSILSKEIIRKKICTEELICGSLLLILFGQISAYLLLVVFLVFLNIKQPEYNIILMIGLTIFTQISIVFEVYFQCKHKSKNITFSRYISSLISSILKVTLILTHSSLIIFALSYIADGIIIIVCYYFLLKQKNDFDFEKFKISYYTLQLILTQSWPLLLSSLLTSVYWKIDQIMLKMFLGDFEVGQYTVAARLSESLYFLPVAIVIALNPTIVSSKEQNNVAYKKIMRNLYSSMIYISLPISVMTYMASDLIVLTLYGNAYYPSSGVLKIHTWACVFVFIGVASGRWLVNEGIQIYLTLNQCMGAISNIVLNLFLIPRYGIEGAAWATLISYALAGYFSFFIWKKTRDQFWIITASCFSIPFYR